MDVIRQKFPQFDEAGQALQDWHDAPAKVCRYLISLD